MGFGPGTWWSLAALAGVIVWLVLRRRGDAGDRQPLELAQRLERIDQRLSGLESRLQELEKSRPAGTEDRPADPPRRDRSPEA